jgi:uncharacterized coiled-coil protein SlyX
MYSLNQVNKLVSCGRDPARSLPLWRGFLLIPLILLCFALSLNAAPGPQTPDPVSVSDPFGTADGLNALANEAGGFANSGFGWYSLFDTVIGSFNTGAGAGTLTLNTADENTAVGAAALILNGAGGENTAVGAGAMVFNAGDATTLDGFFNDAVGAFALNANVTGFSNNAVGNSALFGNITGADNTAVGDIALENNDVTGHGTANFNTAVGAAALVNDVDGGQNTAVGNNAGPNIANGFGNTYLGDSVGSADGTPDESNVIRIGDLSNDNGAGSLACYIGGIFNNPQPVGGDVVVVTLNTLTDQLGFDPAMGRPGQAPAAPHRNAPQPRLRPQAHHQAMLNNDKAEKLAATVAQQQVTLAQQQKQIDTLTAQLQQQAEQIQKVSAQLEMVRPAPRVVNNQ